MQPNKEQLSPEQKELVKKRIHRSSVFQRTFKGSDGEETLKEIDVFSSHKNDTFDPDPYMSAYQAGRRSVSVFIHNVISQDVEKAEKMLKGE